MKNARNITNPFYENIRKHGYVIDAPVAVRPSFAGRKPSNPFCEMEVTLGRPRRGETRAATVLKSIRMPMALWRAAKKRAHAEGVSANAAMQNAIAAWVRSRP